MRHSVFSYDSFVT